jgi:hypothetical protein
MRKLVHYLWTLGVLLLCLLCASAQQGGQYDNSWWTVNAGGGTFASGGIYETGVSVGEYEAAIAGELLGGPYSNIGGFWGVPWLAPSNGDVDGSGCIDDADLLAVLFTFGTTGCCVFQDINQDGVVDDADLLTVLFNFGQGC